MRIFLLDHEAYKKVFEEELARRGKLEKNTISWKDIVLTSVAKELPKIFFNHDAYFLHIIGRDEFRAVCEFKKQDSKRKIFLRANLGPTFDYTSFPEGIRRYGGQKDVSKYIDELLQQEALRR